MNCVPEIGVPEVPASANRRVSFGGKTVYISSLTTAPRLSLTVLKIINDFPRDLKPPPRYKNRTFLRISFFRGVFALLSVLRDISFLKSRSYLKMSVYSQIRAFIFNVKSRGVVRNFSVRVVAQIEPPSMGP